MKYIKTMTGYNVTSPQLLSNTLHEHQTYSIDIPIWLMLTNQSMDH